MNAQQEIPKNMFKNNLYIVFVILGFILIYLLFKENPISLDPKGFIKNTAFNISYLTNGGIVVTDPNGKVIFNSNKEFLNKGGLKALDSFSIAVTEAGSEKNNDNKLTSFTSSIVSSAVAGVNGSFYDYTYISDNQPVCLRFTYPEFQFVGFCP
jgi:hypothetical protein